MRRFRQCSAISRTRLSYEEISSSAGYSRYNDDMPDQHWIRRLFQPGRSRSIPYARACNIALRTAHLMTTSMFVGGYVFSAPAGQLRFLLHLAIATGVGLILIETYPSLHFVFEGWGIFLLVKLALLHFVATQQHRVLLILAVIALACVGSHMPGKLRHYSVLERKVVDR